MSLKPAYSLQGYDYILDKPARKLELLAENPDDGGAGTPNAVDSFLTSVVEAYGMVSEMTSSDKQQVSSRMSAVKEKSCQCNHEMLGGCFVEEKWKLICNSVMDTLIQTVEEARGAQMLRQVQLCEHNLTGILKCGFIEIIVTEYKRLLTNTARLLEYVYKYLSWGTIKGKGARSSLLLCASQLQKLFPLLLRALEVSDSRSNHCVELKDYVVQRMKVCILKIKEIVQGVIPVDLDESDDLGGGLFIMHMDHALSFLAMFGASDEQSASCSKWRPAVEAVLQHAMSIAQIASEFDFKMIHASGEKILRECDSLDKECSNAGSNPSVRKLHASSLSNALEELEQRVCASVLKMYLQVFCDPFAPLRALWERCCIKSADVTEHAAEDLSDFVFNFDTHTDRIIQVAVFAIACSEDQNRVLGIRSCLASLESLETNLVPALTTFYLTQMSVQQSLANLLVEHWNSEIEQLWQLINGIVDPAALAQVTHNVIWAPTAVIKKSIISNRMIDQDELEKLVRSIASNADVFSHQLQASAEELHLAQHLPASQALNNLLLAVREVKAVLQKIVEKDSRLGVDRILKRCELLVTCVGHIQPLLEELDDPNLAPKGSLPCDESEIQTQTMTTGKCDNPPSMKTISQRRKLVGLGLPADAEIEIDTTDAAESVNLIQSFFDKTSAQPRFATSFLYNEKSQSYIQGFRNTPRSVPSTHIFSRKVFERQENLLQHTFALNVPKLASLSETLRVQNSPVIPPPLSYQFHERGSELEEENSSDNISTPERMQDLLQVQNRIDAVKISSESDQSLFSNLIL